MRTAILAALLSAGIAQAADAAQLNPDQQVLRELYRQLVETDTTHAHGSTTLAAQAMARRLLDAGFPAADVQLIEPHPTKGNLVARWRAPKAERKPLLLMAHLDVVEALPEDWSVPPFKLLEQDGFFYGRGTKDDKAMAAIFVANLIRLKREGFVPDRDLILLLSADEEGGPHNGVDWLISNRPELIDAAYAINEGGGGALKNGRYLSNAVQASEKVFVSFTIEARNAGGHSSRPRPDNAIYQLAAGLGRLSTHAFPIKLNEITQRYLAQSAAFESGQIAQDMAAVARDPSDAAAVARLSQHPMYNAIVRSTCVPTLLSGGHAENALPQMARATVNCRILPGEDPEAIRQSLVQLLADPGLTVSQIAAAKPSPPSPLTPEVMGAIESITEAMWPGVPVIPTMSTGATDGLYLRSAGIPVYGVSGIFSDVDDNRAHGRDERLEVKSLYEGQEFLYRLTRALAE